VIVTGKVCAGAPFPTVTVATWFVTGPQLLVVVGEVMWITMLALGARVAKLQVSTCGFAFEIEQPSGGVGVGVIDAMDQLSPALLGNVSVRETLVAVPAPELVMVIVNPIGSVAFTLGLSALLLTVTFGQLTVIVESDDVTLAVVPLVRVAVAWLVTVPQVAEVVVEVMCTDNDALGARLTPLVPPQVSTPEEIEHPCDGRVPHPDEKLATLQLSPGLVGSVSVSLTL
jgi:hypothetical protein